MQEIELKIYERKKGLTQEDKALAVVIGVGLLLMLLGYFGLFPHPGLNHFLGIGIMLAFMLRLRARSFYAIEKLHGTLNSSLVLKRDSITIGDRFIHLSEILNMSISVDDYEGSITHGSRSHKYSIGVHNYFKLKLKSGETIHLMFQMQSASDLSRARDLFLHYYESEILHFINLIDILGIQDYDEIQKFKSTLKFRPY